jgi:GAF domain-containing protein/HAMP domain-containing protein
VFGLLSLLVDLFIPTDRIVVQGFQFVVYIVLGLCLLILGFAIVRQFRDYSLRTKMVTVFVVTVVAAVGIVAFLTNRSLSATLTEQIGTSFAELADAKAIEIGQAVDRESDVLKALAFNKAIQSAAQTDNWLNTLSQTEIEQLDQQWRAADAADNNNDPLVASVLQNGLASDLRQFQEEFPQHVEVFLTNHQGVSIASTNRTSDYYQADEEWWQTAYEEGLFIGQPEYDESSKTIALNMAVPVQAVGSESIVGILRTTVTFETLTESLVSGLFGKTGHTDIYLPDGQELSLEAGEDGAYEIVMKDAELDVNLLTQSQKPYLELLHNEIPALASQALMGVQGDVEEDEIAIANLNWRVVVLQDRAEALQPVDAQTRNILFMAIVIITAAVVAAIGLSQIISGPIVRLNAVAKKVASGELSAQAKVETGDETGALATTFNTMTAQLRELIGTLEQRVAERTQNLELAAEVGRSVSQVRELDVMLQDACELIQKEFDLYYVQVYLTDPSQTALQLQTGTGVVGAQLRERGHSLQLNTGSINGRAAVEKRSVVISNTAASATFRPNPLLPDTRAEMAVPLIVADNVVGVLDMQSRQPGALTEEVLPAFEALAGQLAVAIQNANLLKEAEQARAEVEAQARRLVRTGWAEYMDAVHKPEQIGFVFDHNEVAPLAETNESQLPEDGKAISAPIAITGESLGSLVVELDDEARRKQTAELVNTVARQVAQQLENLRLLENAERYRFEAEQAARRQTREGWQAYIESRSKDSLGYLYDLKEVRPYKNGKDDANALTLPLKARDETIGKLSVQGLDPDDRESFELANAVAERLGAHIESLRLFEETKQGQVELDKRARQLAAVAEISTASSQELEVDKLLSTVVHLTQRQFGLYHAHVFTYDEAAEELRIAACGWKEGDEHGGANETVSIPLDQEQSLVARAARTRQAVIVNDVKNEPGWLANELLPDTASEMAVPLVIGDQVLGVLDVQSDRINAFTEEDANIQTTLASQVATAMQNARSFAQAQRQAERETMLNTINQKIQSATSVEAVLQIAARELGHALGAPMTIAQLSLKEQN